MPSKPWFRVHVAILRSRKVQTLSPALFKWLINLWAVTADNNGVLPPVEDLAWIFHCQVSAVQAAIRQLIEKRLLDQIDGAIVPHDWAEWQFESDTSTDRVKRFRERKRNVSSGVSDTASTVAETKADVSSAATGNVAETPRARDRAEQSRYRADLGGEKRFVEICAGFDRHAKHSNFETRDSVVATVAGMDGLDWDLFQSRHPAYCSFWDAKGWEYSKLTFLGWIRAGMPAPPSAHSAKNSTDEWAESE